jgi:predicted ATP-dependent endonuclease of OLD family
MLRTFGTTNFRSIKEANLDLAPLTFIYGHNAAGKSSVFYALNVARNIILNTNQPVDAFFKLGFFDLGGFNQVVFRHNEANPITFTFPSKSQKVGASKFVYQISLGAGNKGSFSLTSAKPWNLSLKLDVIFPYTLSANAHQDVELEGIRYKINWNGITAQVVAEPSTDDSNRKAQEITEFINRATEDVRAVDIVPVRRGFTQIQYGPVNVTSFPIDETHVAAKLAAEPYLYHTLSTYLEELVERQFTVHAPVGSGQFRLQTIEKQTKQSVDLVNDGFGVNQLVYLLAKTLNKQAKLICVEEPEVNLHPAIVRKLPKVLYELVTREDKQLVISTHSADLVLAVLSAIADGKIKSDQVAFYLANRIDGGTTFKRETINQYGQVSGGLSSFLEGEFDMIRPFLASENKEIPPKIKRAEQTSESHSVSNTDAQEPETREDSTGATE